MVSDLFRVFLDNGKFEENEKEKEEEKKEGKEKEKENRKCVLAPYFLSNYFSIF